jgi:magnesium-transporting ATPase (P-type)
MGVLLRCPRGLVHLFEKGADEVVFRRAVNYDEDRKPFRSIEKHQSKVDQFSKQGLRTLVLAHRMV